MTKAHELDQGRRQAEEHCNRLRRLDAEVDKALDKNADQAFIDSVLETSEIRAQGLLTELHKITSGLEALLTDETEKTKVKETYDTMTGLISIMEKKIINKKQTEKDLRLVEDKKKQLKKFNRE